MSERCWLNRQKLGIIHLLAWAISTEVFIHLERIDEVDEVYDYQAAEINYLQTLQDFDAFLTLIPIS
ncbi:MAG: hypothetical protein PUP92_27985 [Rhizonema sp. PD38]|nr:hypothetical protein [Rhizonema sp. PD38]